MHWTQTKEGREKMAARMREFYKTPKGQHTIKERGKAIAKAAAVKRGTGNGHVAPAAASRAASGRAMLTELAILGAESRIVELRRELEKLTLFVDHAKGKK